ncbi:hypothetical protein WN48_00757 [Eufriesea mexicana]|nr:hypothetical protein WN48_00757 [Eufriesea mexicana]
MSRSGGQEIRNEQRPREPKWRTGPSEILHLSEKTIADVSRGRSFERQEKCPLGSGVVGSREEMSRERKIRRGKRGFRRTGRLEGWQRAESRPISVWSSELGDGLRKPTEVAGLSLPIAPRIEHPTHTGKPNPSTRLTPRSLQILTCSPTRREAEALSFPVEPDSTQWYSDHGRSSVFLTRDDPRMSRSGGQEIRNEQRPREPKWRTGPSEILHLSEKTIADVSRGRSFERQEKCPLGSGVVGSREEMSRERKIRRGKRGFRRTGRLEGWQRAESRPISVWSSELGDGLRKPTEVAGLSLPIAPRIEHPTHTGKPNPSTRLTPRSLQILTCSPTRREAEALINQPLPCPPGRTACGPQREKSPSLDPNTETSTEPLKSLPRAAVHLDVAYYQYATGVGRDSYNLCGKAIDTYHFCPDFVELNETERETRGFPGFRETRPQTSVKIKSVRAVPQDAQERVVPLVVSNSSSEGHVEREGGHEHGPQKGLLDGLAHEQPSSVPGGGSRIDSEGDRGKVVESSTEDLGTACGPGGRDADAGKGTDFKVDEQSNVVGQSKACEALRIEGQGGGATLTETPVLVHHQWRDQEAALDLQLIADNGSEVRSKRPRNASSVDNVVVGEVYERRGPCLAHRHRPTCVSGRHHAEGARRSSNRSCRVHGRRRDRARGKVTERRQGQSAHRDLTSNDFECSVIRLEQDPILEPVRILGCPPSEGLEISSFLEPAPNYVYPDINVAQLAGNEAACYSLYDPNNILPKSRAGSIAKILEGPNRAVKDINRKVLAMARAMTPAWSLRLLGVSCGSVVCAWGLLLILSVLGGGASHGTAFGNFGLGSLSDTMEDTNSARCPWLCMCIGQEVNCSRRGLTQVPGQLASRQKL